MKKSILAPAVAALGMCIGCNTSPDDVDNAETEYKQAQQNGQQMVEDARREGTEEILETRKAALDVVNAEKKDVSDAVREVINVST